MTAIIERERLTAAAKTTALECDFPIVEISQIAEQESWRKEVHRPIYHIHKWWATRLGSVFRGITLAALSQPNTNVWDKFYDLHQFTNKVVLDPFMGSGTTLGEAVKLGAKAIGCDINPVSTFQVRQAFTRVNETQLRAAFANLEQKIASEIRRYHRTRDPQTGELIPVLYYFWVKTVTTPNGETIPLLSRYVFSQNAYPKKKPKSQIVCPSCWEIIEAQYDTTDLTCPHCSQRFDPQQGPVSGQHVTAPSGQQHRIKDLLPADGSPPSHRLYAMMALRENSEKIYLAARDEDLALYEEAKTRLHRETLPLPTLKVRPGHNTDQARGYNYNAWKDFFNPRQLLCLGLLLQGILEIEDEAIQEQLLCLFSSTLEFNNLFCSFKGEGTGAVRHMFANHILKPERTPLENSIWGTPKSSGTFSTLFESRLIRAKRYLEQPFEINLEHDPDGNRSGSKKILSSLPINVQQAESWEQFCAIDNGLMVLNGDSSDLPLPAASVDAIITDPPYFDFVHYSELSDFFFAWLSPALKKRHPWFDRPDSSDQGEVQHKHPRVFAEQLAAVFTECHRVLKDDGIMAFSFHHSRAEGWAAIHEAITRAGFAVVAAHPVHAESRATNAKASAKNPISLDAILVCKKRVEVDFLALDQPSIILETQNLIGKLKAAGMSISSADQFVVLASQMLIPLSSQDSDFDSVCNLLEHAQQTIIATPQDPSEPRA